ncbi:MAG: 50S ribosomal protein L15 [Candidatus Eremiobacteraeota bacterium]|nr:50S ribosomal protein L15 [Candidatus Eremiobacteraeota bacterium]
MQANQLRSNPGARKDRRRVGRGGKLGAQATRGHKGQSSRSGGTKGPSFEGGQTPWYRQLPKYRGFKNPFRTEYLEVTLKQLDQFEDNSTVTAESLREKGFVRNLRQPIKVLGSGSLSKKLTVQLDAYTASAREAIEKAGGKVEVI